MFDKNEIDVVHEKLLDALAVPGYAVEFDPEEAQKAGAFMENALEENDAIESCIDLKEEKP